MTSFRIDRVPFEPAALVEWAKDDPRRANWPVVYTIDGGQRIYVGESIHAATRMHQHLARPNRQHLDTVRVVVDPTFNKSVCLDLEAHLIAWFAGDNKFQIDNANAGLTWSDYYRRDLYREQFRSIFEALRADGLFDGTLTQIENSDLFKLSPFKTLTYDQRIAVMRIVEQLFQDLRQGRESTAVVQGQPGTGKTVVGIFLMKLLSDIRRGLPIDDSDSDAVLAGFFTAENANLLADFRMGIVVPQESLRETVSKVFKGTPGLERRMVLSPYDVGNSNHPWDLLIVDESHRLQQLAATMSIKQFRAINSALFEGDERGGTQLDWIRRKSRHRIFMLDVDQRIRPLSDLPPHVTRGLQDEAAAAGRLHALTTQMRVRADEDYIGYVREVLSDNPPPTTSFEDYEFLLFDDMKQMRRAIAQRDREVELSRLVAGYAWKWRSKADPTAFDIEIDGERLRWNGPDKDWVSSPNSANEVGSIHKIQGYDLNYAGVIIGPDLRFDSDRRQLYFVRDSYFDTNGKKSNAMLGQRFTDDDLLTYVVNIYRVLLSRGIRGTYVYVCDPALREYLRDFIPAAPSTIADARDAAPTFDIRYRRDEVPRIGEETLAVEFDASDLNEAGEPRSSSAVENP